MNKSMAIITSMIVMLGGSSTPQASQEDIINQINLDIQQHPSSANRNYSAFLPTEKFILMDFEDQETHDKEWLLSQPHGHKDLIVQGKSNSGTDKFSIAIGEGRNGSNALLVESTNKSMGLPGFWISKAKNNKWGISRLKTKEGYLIPNNIKANRLEFWVRFEDGFRYNKASAYPPSYPNHYNLLIGTHHFDPSKINGTTTVDKSNNWNFYHQVFLRHDKAGGGWIHVIINQQPQKQSNSKSLIPNNPTMPAGNYFNLLTKFYVDLAPYFSNPETPYPVKMWVDDIALSYVPESPDLTIDFLGHSLGDSVDIVTSKERLLAIDIKNNKSKVVCGSLSLNVPDSLNPKLVGNDGFITPPTTCFDANSSTIFDLNISPNSKLPIGKTGYAGLTFVNEDTILSDTESTNRSLTDNNIEKRWIPETGAHDSIVSSNFINFKIASSLTNSGGSGDSGDSGDSGGSGGSNNSTTADKFVIMDFEDSVLHNENWFNSQQKGYAGFFVEEKADSGKNKLSLAKGGGRNGGNALLVESTNKSMGLPSFFVIKAWNAGGYASRFTDKGGYWLPSNRRANRLEFWLKFENGFRNNSASAQPPSYPNHENLHIGTYHYDPSKIDGLNQVLESNNWHFYHQVFLRHDKAGSDWIHVVVNQQPQHQRSIKSSVTNNPTMPAGNYFEILTRLYIDLKPYFSDPEKSYPVKMLVDDITLSYVPEPASIAIKILNHSQGETINVTRNKEASLAVTITNNESKEFCGELSLNSPSWLNPRLQSSNGANKVGAYCIAANSTETLNFKIKPDSSEIGNTYNAGITFADDKTMLSDSTSRNRSLSDGNVEKRWYSETGPHDGVAYSDFIRVSIK